MMMFKQHPLVRLCVPRRTYTQRYGAFSQVFFSTLLSHFDTGCSHLNFTVEVVERVAKRVGDLSGLEYERVDPTLGDYTAHFRIAPGGSTQ